MVSSYKHENFLLEKEAFTIQVQPNSLEIVKKDKIINKYLSEKKIKRVIFIKNRLINILIDD